MTNLTHSRIDLANESLCDAAEGKLTGAALELEIVRIIGWTDLCGKGERRQLLALAARLDDIRRAA